MCRPFSLKGICCIRSSKGSLSCVFLFQAEDVIRDGHVTGVQTCALPILHGGWLEAWGERAKGSVFRLTLPREVGAKLAGSPLPLAPDQADFGSLAAETAADLRVTVHRARFRAPAPIEDRR